MIIQKSRAGVVSILIQILVWLVFALVLLFNLPLTSGMNVPYQFWIKQSVVLVMLVIAFYLNSMVLVPRFLLKNRIGYYLGIILLITAAILLINEYTDRWLNMHVIMDAAFHHHGPHDKHPRIDFITLMIVALMFGISISITTVQKWQADKMHNQVLKQEKTQSELSFLKAQINPHFFFNTLNNIYALTYVDADTSRKAIHQLSRMMRYLLYETPQADQLISQEIVFIKDYISLMQLRLTNAVTINFESPDNLNDMPIASMIFLPFVENAFKHGISTTDPSYINILITQKDKMLELFVTNSVSKIQSADLNAYGGIGLNNTRRRLDLLYPGDYKLKIDELVEANEYHVHLTLNLS
ncbi:hypothetical protein FO440_09425 [Mucilaginibacter corticis]|uniref:Signal transduction histidine kinase internal region domain-containing protein n=1 Tax=Mucilaginibacter corticis TaxID=2597670 RepID=A0A556MX52_9SPHI|nr:histidine kinase [Mucilaginibacter corticis]TSJ44379.1 hypothetical protein FO440_09425 [Mucilaginibacter corticis]